MDFTTNWSSLFWLLVILVLLYGLIHLMDRVLQLVINRSSLKKRLERLFGVARPLFLVLAAFITLMVFVSINYIVHGILLALLSVIGFPYIRSFLNGMLIKMNPLINLGVQLSSGSHQGEIVKFLALGVIINETEGERYINYTDLSRQGFAINRQEEGSLRSSIRILSDQSDQHILDLLYKNPLVKYDQRPILRDDPEKGRKLLFTLESGAKIENFVDYLKQHDILTEEKI